MRVELVLELIQAHLKKEEEVFLEKANQIAEEESKKGNKNNSGKILSLLKENEVIFQEKSTKIFSPSSGSSDLIGKVQKKQIISPRDKSSNIELFEVHYPSEFDQSTMFLSSAVENKINSILSEHANREILLNNGLPTENRLLLCGPPGCGKTSTAYMISSKLDLPLIYVRLDSLVSSFLGQTGTNMRKIFDAVNGKPVVLLLDEFDAIAKKRDDKNELGELKRVVNTLLQNLDLLSNDVFVIAATNHESLLDEAIWRRFNSVMYLDLPNKKMRSEYIKYQMDLYDIEDGRLNYEKLSNFTAGLNFSQIQEISLKAIKNTVLNHKTREMRQEDYIESLINVIFLYNTDKEMLDVEKVRKLRENGVTLQMLSELLKIPRTTLNDRLKKGERKNE